MTAPPHAAHLTTQGAPFYMALAVKSVGSGRDTNPLLASQFSTGDFKTALGQSLWLNTLLATEKPKYNVNATMKDREPPVIGLPMMVTASVHNWVAPTSLGQPVFDKTITTPYTAAFGDALVGVERLRLANEGAIRTNITSFTGALAAVQPMAIPGA